MRLSPIVALVACAAPARAPVANLVPAPRDTSLAAVLTAEVGAGSAVAILPGKTLRAISSDGARERVLWPNPVSWTLVDLGARAIWFGDDDGATLYALDLDATAPQPVLVAADLPRVSPGVATAFRILYPGGILSFGALLTPHIQLEVSAAPKLSADGGIMTLWNTAKPFEDGVAKARIVDPAFVARLAKRSSGITSAAVPPPTRVDGVDPSNCQEPSVCGTAEPIVHTGLLRVVVGYGCGDGCYRDFQLYDARAKAFLTGEWTKQLVDAWVAPDGSAFVRAGVVYRFDRGPLAQTPPLDGPQGGGWLGDGAYYGQ
jgi:hypothetical protein